MLADRHWMTSRPGYTWARAMDTARHLRQGLGFHPDRLSLLDKLRQALTQVGTTLGYVRAVRGAGMRAAARSLPYVEAAVGQEAFSAAA
eukprot:12798014-Heterocapsa_arctica.AAC.1